MRCIIITDGRPQGPRFLPAALSWRLVVLEMNLKPTLLLPALVVFDLDFTLVRG